MGRTPHLPHPPRTPLTEQERRVLVLVGEGCSNAEIGDALCIAEGTVKAHLVHLTRKLEIRSRYGLIVYAFRMGLVNIPTVPCRSVS